MYSEGDRMKETTTRKAMLIGTNTYSYFYPDNNEFCCGHGGCVS